MNSNTRTPMRRRAGFLLSGIAAAVLAVTSCSTAATEQPPTAPAAGGVASAADVVPAETVIFDVRTPAEFDDGHLPGAVLLDWSGGQFAARIDSFDRSSAYIVYCRSGSRSGQAVAMMRSLGFTDITDLGPVGNAAAVTGLGLVR